MNVKLTKKVLFPTSSSFPLTITYYSIANSGQKLYQYKDMGCSKFENRMVRNLNGRYAIWGPVDSILSIFSILWIIYNFNFSITKYYFRAKYRYHETPIYYPSILITNLDI